MNKPYEIIRMDRAVYGYGWYAMTICDQTCPSPAQSLFPGHRIPCGAFSIHVDPCGVRVDRATLSTTRDMERFESAMRAAQKHWRCAKRRWQADPRSRSRAV